MTKLIAEEKDQNSGPKLVDVIPYCDVARFIYDGNGTSEAQVYRYANRKHTLHDMLRPGYFDPAAEAGLRPWDEIHFTIGGPGPVDAVRGILVTEKVRGHKNTGVKEQTIVAIVTKWGQATPVRHDGRE